MNIIERDIVLKKGKEFRNRRVLIVGMARSGVAAAALANEIGAVVTITDTKKREELGDVWPAPSKPLLGRWKRRARTEQRE